MARYYSISTQFERMVDNFLLPEVFCVFFVFVLSFWSMSFVIRYFFSAESSVKNKASTDIDSRIQ